MASELAMRPRHGDVGQTYEGASTDWRAKYLEVADVLADTRSELEQFQATSKELEEELELELQRTEAEKERLRVRASKAEGECEEWKDRYIKLQTLHNTTTNSLQKDLDLMKQEYHTLKVSMRELEMGNDHLERSERAVASNLADLEARYAKALEEKILLDHELLDKARLEEDFQRLKDEHRDASEEITRLRRKLQDLTDALKLQQATAAAANAAGVAERRSESTTSLPLTPASISSNDLLLSDLDANKVDQQPWSSTLNTAENDYARHSLEETPIGRRRSLKAVPALPSARSSTTPFSQSTLPKRNPLPYLLATERSSAPRGSTASLAATSVSKSKGVQMVSEMRTRVRNLELKIHSRLPRIRLGSMSRSAAPSPNRQVSPLKPDKLNRVAPSLKDDRPGRRSIESRDRKGAESPGWVLIMEESPHKPSAADQKRRRRLSSPQGAPSSFREPSKDENAPSVAGGLLSAPTAKPRPSSTLAISTTQGQGSNNRSAKSPDVRPTTPTFLPVPSRPPSDFSTSGAMEPRKRSSLDRTAFSKSTFAKPSSIGAPARRQSAESSSNRRLSGGGRPGTTAPRSSLPGGLQSVEPTLESDEHVRPESRSSVQSRLSTGTSLLSKSRIGRPIKRESGGSALITGEGAGEPPSGRSRTGN